MSGVDFIGMIKIKQLSTILFLAGCLIAGLGLAHLMQRGRGKIKERGEPKQAVLPAVRGVMLPWSVLRPAGTPGNGAAGLVQACVRGNINYVMLDGRAETGGGGGEGLPGFMAALHNSKLRGGVLIRMDPRDPEALRRGMEMGALVRQGGVDLLAVTPASNEEVTAKQWTLGLRKLREASADSGVAIAFVAWRDDVAGVTWWEASDYVGVLGPFAVAGQKDPTPLQLQVGWQAQLMEIRSIARSSNKPALLLAVDGGGVGVEIDEAAAPSHTAPRQDRKHALSPELRRRGYAAALEAAKRQSDLAGLFLRLPAGTEGSEPVGVMTVELLPLLQRHWPVHPTASRPQETTSTSVPATEGQ